MPAKLSWGARFAVFQAVSILATIVAAGILVGLLLYERVYDGWIANNSVQLTFMEERLRASFEISKRSAANPYVVDSIVDHAMGGAPYLPRELALLAGSRGFTHVRVVDAAGQVITSIGDGAVGRSEPAIRSVLETGQPRLWCDPHHEQIVVAHPIIHDHRPEGALVGAIRVSSLQYVDETGGGARAGSTRLFCDGALLFATGERAEDDAATARIDASADRQPLLATVDARLEASQPLWNIVAPAVSVIGMLLALGALLMVVGGLIARSLEHALIKARDEALSAGAARSQFLANMSHEIRTPLSGVLGHLELLLTHSLPPDAETHATEARSSGEVLRQLVDDILDMSKIDAGLIETDPRPCDVHSLLERGSASYELLAGHKSLALSLHIAPDVPAWIRCDELRLRQILNNLVSNAIKFTPAGEIAITAAVDRSASPPRLAIAVNDTGIGIAPDKLDGLFAPFTQAESSTTRSYGGTGLGLYISQQLARLMGGGIDVQSVLGEGSTFALHLPADEVAVPRPAEPSPPGDVQSDLRAMRILVAEDNATNQIVIRRMLELEGHEVTLVENGEKAVDEVTSSTYDAVFMDCQMPIMDGFEATRQISARLGVRAPWIIALTANAFVEDRQRCLQAGMRAYIAKPATKNALRQALIEAQTALDTSRDIGRTRPAR